MFGTIIESEDLACYKVEREEIVTTYLSLLDMKTKKPLVF